MGVNYNFLQNSTEYHHIFDSIVVRISACHAGDRGSIPRRGGYIFLRRCRIRLGRERIRGHALLVIVVQWTLPKARESVNLIQILYSSSKQDVNTVQMCLFMYMYVKSFTNE